MKTTSAGRTHSMLDAEHLKANVLTGMCQEDELQGYEEQHLARSLLGLHIPRVALTCFIKLDV